MRLNHNQVGYGYHACYTYLDTFEPVVDLQFLVEEQVHLALEDDLCIHDTAVLLVEMVVGLGVKSLRTL